jgi:epoxyqueuosine reductase QueG
MTDSAELAGKLRELLTENGACLVGFADLSGLPASCRRGFPRAVAIAVALDPAVVKAIEDGPTEEYYREYIRANRLLYILADKAADLIREHGYEAHPMQPTTGKINSAISGDFLPHKTAATRAGLGWIGKCALLVTEEYGSALRLTTVLTDAGLPTVAPIDDSRCGDCRECVEFCPANAPSGRQWEAGTERELIYDVYACRDKARELSESEGINEIICGICIAVCPWTRSYLSRTGK